MKDSDYFTRSSRSSSPSNDSPSIMNLTVDPNRQRFPFCIVWTPIPLLTYFMPFIGHMGIATSAGIIRDFAGPYHVAEDKMAFGQPTKYWQLDYNQAKGGLTAWDSAVSEASEIYRTRMVGNIVTVDEIQVDSRGCYYPSKRKSVTLT